MARSISMYGRNKGPTDLPQQGPNDRYCAASRLSADTAGKPLVDPKATLARSSPAITALI